MKSSLQRECHFLRVLWSRKHAALFVAAASLTVAVAMTLGSLEFGIAWLLYGCWLAIDRHVCIIELNLLVRLMSLLLAFRLHAALRCGVLMTTSC